MRFIGSDDSKPSAIMEGLKVGLHVVVIALMIFLLLWTPANYDSWWVWIVVVIAFIILALSSISAVFGGSIKTIKSIF